MSFLMLLVLISIIILTSIGQIFLKIGAIRHKKGTIGLLTNSSSIIGYLLFIIVSVLSIYVLQAIALKLFLAVTSLTYIIVLFLSSHFLHEKITNYKLLGVGLITIGVIFFNF